MSAGRTQLTPTPTSTAALTINASLPDGWLNKGFLRLRQGNGREALPLIQKGIDAGAGRQALAIFARGVAHEQMGEYTRRPMPTSGARASWSPAGRCRGSISRRYQVRR